MYIDEAKHFLRFDSNIHSYKLQSDSFVTLHFYIKNLITIFKVYYFILMTNTFLKMLMCNKLGVSSIQKKKKVFLYECFNK